MSQEERAKEIFAAIDKNGDGVASAEEITAALTRACVPNPAAETAAILLGKEAVPFDYFYGMNKKEAFYSLALFAFIDTNNDGKISKEEFQVAFSLVSGPKDFSGLFALLDTDHDGVVSYPDMKAFFSKK